MKIQLFCKCGAGAEGEVGPLSAAEKLRRLWYEVHDGPGHGDCEREEAKRALLEQEEKGFKTHG
jgi:hypothetical protein